MADANDVVYVAQAKLQQLIRKDAPNISEAKE